MGVTLHEMNNPNGGMGGAFALRIGGAVWGVQLALASVALGVVASDFEQTNINSLIGADRFYENGYSGQGARAAIIEGGLVWNGDPSMSHVTNYFYDSEVWSHSFGDEQDLWDRHATWSGNLLGGRGPAPSRTGIAPMVDLSSAATATRWVGSAYTSNWSQTLATANAAYKHFTVTDPVDVISSSWGFSDSDANSSFVVGIDALAYENPFTLHVAASGNSGFSSNSVLAPASGVNVLSVGGLGYEEGRYDARWSSSGRGLSDYYDPVNGLIRGVRASVDLMAPAQNISALRYGGTTGGNNPTLAGAVESATRDSNGLFGTSLSTPIAAGAVSLLHSLRAGEMSENEESRDARVVKAVLINSADKLFGWDSGLLDEGGVLTTRQSLDAEQGAGRINLEGAFEQYGPSGGAFTGELGLEAAPNGEFTIGWDLGEMSPGESFFYELGDAGGSGEAVSGSLVWYRERQTVGGSTEDLKQADFDLFLWVDELGAGEFDLVAQSISEYNTTEHLELILSRPGRYRFEVRYDGDIFRTLDASESEIFGFAWNLSAVPEPASCTLIFALLAGSFVSVRRR